MPTPPPLVVVVEDDVATRTALGRVLRAGGFEAATYRSAEEFLAAPPSRVPHCLVVETGLKGMSGPDLQRRLTSLGSKLPVIVMTAFEDARVRDEARRAGCAGYLDKEAEIDVLLKMIKSL